MVNARVLITLANAEFQLVGLTVALSRLEAAEQAVAAAQLSALQVSLHNQRGLFLFKVGQMDGALREFDQAESFFPQAPVVERCRVLLNRGSVHLDRGSVAAARVALTQCAEIAAAADLPLFRLKAMHNLGYLEFLVGDLPGALRLMAEAFRMDPTVSPRDRACSVGREYWRRRVWPGSPTRCSPRRPPFSGGSGSPRTSARLSWTGLACALISGDISDARPPRSRRPRSVPPPRQRLMAAQRGTRPVAGGPCRWAPGASRLVEPALRLREELTDDGLPRAGPGRRLDRH